MSIYSFKVKDARGGEKDLVDFQGKILLIVNVASKCGFTPQYEGLQQLYEVWHDRGLEILGFPCDQFGHQEPGSDSEIQQFCRLNYGVTFPVFSKIEVNGMGAHPLYRYLTGQKPGPKGSDIQWNFTKFLVDRNGNIAARLEPSVRPEDITPLIASLLA